VTGLGAASTGLPGSADLLPPSGRSEGAFTLLELIAVILIIGLVAGLAVPNLGLLGEQRLRDEARRLAGELELARQRSVVTGIRHRMVLDLDESLYWIEWEVPEEEPVAPVVAAGSDRPPSLSPPEHAESTFVPRPDPSGRGWRLDDDVLFGGVEIDSGLVERGRLSLAFEPDGSTEAIRILLARPDGRTLGVEVRPLAEAVRVVDDETG
jgi:prepilin-type N-terminal cleavage/methylation domain-containing protein